jgi:PDZ domain
MKFLLSLATLVALEVTGLASNQPGPAASIVRVNVTNQSYNFALPWQKRQPGNRQGLGALLPGNKVLTTAELIQDATYLELELASTGRKLTARAESIDYEANLAILVSKTEADGFFDGLVPLELSSTAPKKGEKFEVWQFESNGSPVTTELVFEKAELGSYFLEGSYFLQFETNGALNYREGSFTLPVVRQGQLAGLLLTYDNDKQVAKILPYPIIKAFLNDAADGTYAGFPSFGIKFAPTLDDQLRAYLKLGDDHPGGVLVTGVMPGTSASNAGLKEGDVLLEVGGHGIDSRGNYVDETWGLLAMGHLVKGATTVGAELPLKIVRDGQALGLTLKLSRKGPSDYLVDPYMFDRGPRFLILGGIVFEELTKTYLMAFGNEWKDRAPFPLVYATEHQDEFAIDGRRKLVFIAGVLPSESTLGYEGLRGALVQKVNDQLIKDIQDLEAALAKPADGLHKIQIDEVPYTIYLDSALADQDNQTLLPQRYRIKQLKRLE